MKEKKSKEEIRKSPGQFYYETIGMISLIFAIVILLIILCGSSSVETAILFLPFAFFGVNLFFFLNYVQKDINLTKLIVFILYFVRLVVLPFLYYASGETRLYEGNIPSDD